MPVVSRTGFLINCNFNQLNCLRMLLYRNFIYWIDKRKWKYVFLLKTLELSYGLICS